MANPRCSVSFLIGRDMPSFATLTKPAATSSTVYGLAPALEALISAVRASNFLREAETSSGSLAFGPKIEGNCDGMRRPRIRLASVMASSPPLR